MKDTIYLGDGVYIDFDGYMHILYTDNGIERKNIIYLEPDVKNNLIKHLTKDKEKVDD